MAFSILLSTILRGKWLIAPREVEANSVILQKLLDGSIPGSNKRLSEEEPIPCMLADASGKMSRSNSRFSDAPEGSTAIIPIRGTLIKYGTLCSYGTEEYAEIIREAANEPNISSIVLDCHSGGGAVDAIAPLVDAIADCKRKNKGCVAAVDLCASAMYYAACHCDSIICTNNISSELGSIGVMMSFADYAKYYENMGIKVHTIYSNLSDYKNAPYEAALKGEYDKIKTEELDPLARQFQATVKKRRCNLKLDTEGILSGRMFYADEAVRVGLADEVGTIQTAIQRSREIEATTLIHNYINLKTK